MAYSIDRGNSWQKLDTLPNTYGLTLTVDKLISLGSTILANADGLLYRSTDSGAHWLLSMPDTLRGTVTHAVANDSNFFITTPDGVYRSRKSGASWTKVHWAVSPQAIVASGSLLYLVTDSDTTQSLAGGLYRSTDNGDSWKSLDTSFYHKHILFLGSYGTALFADASQGAFYRSLDSGLTWALLNPGFQDQVTAMTMQGSNLYAAVYSNGIDRSSDNGITWSHVVDGVTSTRTWDMLPIADSTGNSSRLIAATSTSLQLTTDRGDTWQSVDDKIIAFAANSLLYHHGKLFAAMPTGLFSSSDHGNTWNRAPGALGQLETYSVVGTDSTVFAQSIAPNVTDVMNFYSSTNNGASWDSLAYTGVGNLATNKSDIIQWGAFGAGLDGSTDNGIVWSQLDTFVHPDMVELSNIHLSDSLLVAEMDSAGSTHRTLIVSSDFGKTWMELPEADRSLSFLAVDGTTIYASAYLTPFDTAIYRSNDKGVTWQEITRFQNLTNFAARRNLVLAVGQTGVLFSTNRGDTWSPMNAGLPSFDIAPITIGDSEIYVGLRSNGIYRTTFPASASVGARPSTAAPGLAAYPNPLSTTTTIRFSSNERSRAQISILNILGEEVSSLYSGELPAGLHDFTWDASSALPGMYICVVHENGRSVVMPISVVR